MTEAEWFTDVSASNWHRVGWLIDFARPRLSDRKLRLIGLACYGYPRDLPDEILTRLAEAISAFAEGEEGYDRVEHWHGIAENVYFAAADRNAYRREIRCLHEFARLDAGDALNLLLRKLRNYVGEDEPRPDWCHTEAWCRVIREVFGNPFRPITFEPVWRASDVMLLARGIYEERAFDRMPILADALQDAGCDNTDILEHLRDANATHVRGCWALDLVLGKE